jgi:hypothetical protein
VTKLVSKDWQERENGLVMLQERLEENKIARSASDIVDATGLLLVRMLDDRVYKVWIIAFHL